MTLDAANHQLFDTLYEGDSNLWKEPDYASYDKDNTFRRLSALHEALRSERVATYSQDELDEAWRDTEAFFTQAFDDYEAFRGGGKSLEPAKRSFIVPMRTSGHSDKYADETEQLAPLISPRFGVDPMTRMRAIADMPPTILTRYNSAHERFDTSGAVVFAPVFGDMLSSITGPAELKQLRRRIADTALFATSYLDTQYLGLGAVLPSLTKYGTSINKPEGVVTTTGHGGTVYLIKEIATSLLEKEHNTRFGFIGVGSIGKAAARLLQNDYPEAQISLFDVNSSTLGAAQKELGNSTIIGKDPLAVFESSDIIVAAVAAGRANTGFIDLNSLDPDKELDLAGKTIIDDSQPACFDKVQIEERGGTYLPVLGIDKSDGHILERERFDFGNSELSGIRRNMVFGCEAELAAIAVLNRPDLALHGPVTPEQADEIGKALRQIGVVASSSLC